MPRNIVAEIAEQGVIEEVPSPKNQHNYKATSVSGFLELYIVVSVWANTHDCCETKVIKSLRVVDLKPNWGHNVFKKTSSLQETLESIKSEDSWKASEQLALL